MKIRLKGSTMAKKAKAAKAAKKTAKKAAKVLPMKARTASKTAKPAKKRATSPRSQVLPGMEQVRNRVLDRVCEGISDTRGDMNRLRGEEKDLQLQAVKAMQAGNVTAYRFAGVELVLVPGDVKLRVRTMKEGVNADGDSGAGEAGSGQDAGATLEEMTERAGEAEPDQDTE